MNPKILGWPLFGGWLPFIGFKRDQEAWRTKFVFVAQYLRSGIDVVVWILGERDFRAWSTLDSVIAPRKRMYVSFYVSLLGMGIGVTV